MKKVSFLPKEQYLQRLSQVIEQLDAEISSRKDKNVACSFSQNIFNNRQHSLASCLLEVKRTQRDLNIEVQQAQPLQVNFLAQRLLEQISALTREIATRKINYLYKSNRSEDIYQKLARHQDYHIL